MATAKKLKSGNYRVRIYDKDTKKYKSFTAPTKREAERLGSDYLMSLIKPDDKSLTVKEAAENYISDKSAVLSPTTIQGYQTILNNNMDRLLDVNVNDVNVRLVQDWINELSLEKSPKTVKNVYGFFRSVIDYSGIMIDLRKIRLPQRTKNFKRLPPPELIIETFRGSEIELPVLLGLWCGMRMSEILGIRKMDISDGILTIRQVVVTIDGKEVVKKQAKTYNSNREIRLPQPIINLIDDIDVPKNERIITKTRKAIYSMFVRRMQKKNYRITFHDLRHINASVMAALNVPDLYAMERGGWSCTNTLKNVYQQTFDDKRLQVDKTIDDYFNDIYDTRYDTKNENIS